MSFTWQVWAVVIGCTLIAGSTALGDDKPAADDTALNAFVAYLAKNEIKLELDRDGWWVVTDPKTVGFQVVVSLKTFPAGTSEAAMQANLKTINLAHTLNAPVRLAMSSPGLRSTAPAAVLPKLDQVPVVAKLTKLFKDYQLPEPKK